MWLRSTPQVCKISADLHEDLYGSSYRVTTCDRYYEMETYTVNLLIVLNLISKQ
ncbi:unnamed protein product [Brassica oleracea var. botrytis]